MGFAVNLLNSTLTKLGYTKIENNSAVLAEWPGDSSQNLESIPAAFSAVNLLASVLGRLPLVVAEMEDPLQNFWTPRFKHRISALFQAPSSILDPRQFWEWLFRSYIATGNGYAFIHRRGGEPQELIPAVCEDAEWDRRGRIPVARYKIRLLGTGNIGDPRIVPGRNLVTLHGPGFDGLKSPSPIQYAKRTLEVMSASLDHQRGMLSGFSAKNVILTDKELIPATEAKRAELAKELDESYRGARNAGKMPVIPPGFTIESTGVISAADQELIELMKWTIEDVCRAFGIPPRMLFHYHAGFRATKFEFQSEDFDKWSVQNHTGRIESQLGVKLLSERDLQSNLVIRQPSDSIRYGSWSELIESSGKGVANYGIMTINEGRRLLRLPPVEDGDRLMSPKGAPPQGESGELEDEDPDDMEGENGLNGRGSRLQTARIR